MSYILAKAGPPKQMLSPSADTYKEKQIKSFKDAIEYTTKTFSDLGVYAGKK